MIDYGATVPLTSAPFVVQVDPKTPPGDGFRDYVPNPSRKPEVVEARNNPDKYMRPVVRGTDFLPFDKGQERRVAEKSRITALAKEMYAQQAKKRQDYTEARKLVDSCTEEQITNPTPQIERALRILRKPAPLDKSATIEEAKRQYYSSVTEG